MKGLELAGPVERVRSNLMNGIHSMPVKFTATTPPLGSRRRPAAPAKAVDVLTHIQG